jgi:hypothetical protein
MLFFVLRRHYVEDNETTGRMKSRLFRDISILIDNLKTHCDCGFEGNSVSSYLFFSRRDAHALSLVSRKARFGATRMGYKVAMAIVSQPAGANTSLPALITIHSSPFLRPKARGQSRLRRATDFPP